MHRTDAAPISLGTAGWTIPRQNASAFPVEGSSLERYAARLPVVEINSSFHRAHRLSTWRRWRDSVPTTFRFSVKVPKSITHGAKLNDCSGLLDEFLGEAGVLGDKLAILLVQLPPKLQLDPNVARAFFTELRARSSAKLACEPRNASWFTPKADALLREQEVARVAADPAICAAAAVPGGWPALRYWRLHGSPRVYRSSYADRIHDYADLLGKFAVGANETWCIFDNTASSAAMGDALALATALQQRASGN
jgi:uncharacterized protein YecE (DUF72 family)